MHVADGGSVGALRDIETRRITGLARAELTRELTTRDGRLKKEGCEEPVVRGLLSLGDDTSTHLLCCRADPR